ncbi:S41 family peptidase [Candidatus Dojkabacteria bacterium]|nr:S41 family peptidase [Candidatus Dojkabacteria bacterium]
MKRQGANLSKSRVERWIIPVLSFVVVILIFAVGYVLGRTGFSAAFENGEFSYTFSGRLYPEEKELNFDLFWDVWNKLEDTYVEKSIDESDMFDGAIKGMVSSLNDPATRFFSSEETSQYEQERAGKFEGIGIEMGYLDGQVIVRRVFDDSPAKVSGVQVGDTIIGVDSEDVTSMSISEIAEKIRGESGTQVTIAVLRSTYPSSTSQEEKEIQITRGEVYYESIIWEMTDDDIALVTVRRFTENNFFDFALLWDNVVNEISEEDPSGLIIDIRGNGGGYLDGAPYLAGEFLDKGEVVLYVQDREKNLDAKAVSRDGKFKKIPVVILVDSGTASSAEIFAGALQYYKRATIIGERTYGKGTAQDVIKPSTWGGASIHITTQKWLLPDKRWINEDDPITPDIEVEVTIEQFKRGEDPQLERAIEEVVNMIGS